MAHLSFPFDPDDPLAPARGQSLDGLLALLEQLGGAEEADVVRSALPNARILVHQPSGGFQGQASDIQIHAKEALALRRRVEEIYAEHTGKPVEEVSEALERDRFFTPEQARDYGLVDRVMVYRNGNGYSPSSS